MRVTGRRALGFQDAAVPEGDLLPQHVAEGVNGAAFGLHRHVARLHREAGIEIKVVRPTILRPAPGRTACPRRLGEPAFQRSTSTIRARSANDVPLGRRRVVDIAQVTDCLSE